MKESREENSGAVLLRLLEYSDSEPRGHGGLVAALGYGSRGRRRRRSRRFFVEEPDRSVAEQDIEAGVVERERLAGPFRTVHGNAGRAVVSSATSSPFVRFR